MADLDFFRRLMRYEDKELYQNIYENKYTCKVPYSSTLNAYDRNVTVTPVMSLKQYEGYGFQGDNNNPMEGSYKDDEFSEILEGVFGGNEFDADEVVEEYFDTFEVNLEENNYALNRQVNARRTIFEMAELYEDGNFVYLVYPNELKEGWNRRRILEYLNEKDISCDTGICPEIYLENAFVDRDLGPPSRLPNAQCLGETSLMFLVHPTLTPGDISAMAESVLDYLSQFEAVCS